MKMKKMEQKFSSLQIVKIIENLGNEKVNIFIHLFNPHIFDYHNYCKKIINSK